MLAGLLCVIVLLGALLVQRVGGGGALCAGMPVIPPARARHWLGVGLLVLGVVPLLTLAPWPRGAPFTFWGDTLSHARVGAEIARTGLPHGWLDSYVGGFPFGHHYPTLGWILLAAEIKAGLSPDAAVYLLGFCATLALPIVGFLGLVRCGMQPAFSGLAVLVSCWVAPYNAFIGGFETFFSAGLVSQTVAMPVCIWLVVATLDRRNRWEAPLLAWLSMASHPQITVAALVVLGLSALVSARRPAVTEAAWTSTLAIVAGSALYGQGITTLDIPFGWPPDLGWRQVGFPPERLRWWLLDGDLLDLGRVPVITALLAAASLILLMFARRALSRAVLVALLASLLLAVSGRWLLGMGRLGAALLSFLQPLRVVSLIPLLAAVCIAVALEQAARRLQASLRHQRQARLADAAPHLVLVAALSIAGFALPSRLRVAGMLEALQQPSSVCSDVAGYDRDEVATWVAALSGGRLWYEAHEASGLGACLLRDGIDRASAVPIGTAASVGAHVGVLARAAQYLRPERPGSAARAEALGIAYLLHDDARPSALPGWELRERRGSVQLLSQHAQTVGVGCIVRRWSGGADALRKRTNADLADPRASDVLLDPHAFTAIAYAAGPVIESAEPASDCDAAAATVRTVSAEAGAVSAVVRSPAPVDVVFRVSAFPTWTVLLDEGPSGAPTLLAPGFFSVRVPPGEHRLLARVAPLPHYSTIIALAAMATAALAWSRGRRLPSLLERVTTSRPRRR